MIYLWIALVFFIILSCVSGTMLGRRISTLASLSSVDYHRIRDRLTKLEQHEQNRHADFTRLYDQTDMLTREVGAWGKQVSRLEESTGGFWRTQGGHLLQVRDMTDQHLENVWKWLEEHGQTPSIHIVAEINRRAEGKAIQAKIEAVQKVEAEYAAFAKKHKARRKTRRRSR